MDGETEGGKEGGRRCGAQQLLAEGDVEGERAGPRVASFTVIVSIRAESDIAKSELEAAKAKKKMMEIQKELDLKAVEVEQLKAWKVAGCPPLPSLPVCSSPFPQAPGLPLGDMI